MSFVKKPFFIALIILVPIITFLLWPLNSEKWEIKENADLLNEKKEILSRLESSSNEKGPNILLITADDLGMADVSAYGEGNIVTPNIDKLGEEGVVFENAYVTSPVCAPSRAALITGRYQHRFGFEFTMHDRYLKNRLEYLGFKYFVNSYPWEPQWTTEVPGRKDIDMQGLPVSEITLAEILKKQGYKTGVVGKWHLGWSDEKMPVSFGFDEQYGFFMSHSLYAPEGSEGIVDQKIEEDWTDPYIWSGQRKGPHAIYKNYTEVEEKKYLTTRIADESISFISRHQNEPFFLWVSFNAPHTPLQAPKDYVDRYKNIEDPIKRVYRAMINSLDDELGRLMKFLNDNSLDENTIVFFISDNGGAEYTHTTDNGKYEGGKNTEFEGGVKVPMMIRWKGKIPANQRYHPMVSSMDIFSSSVAAVNAEIEISRTIDGVNLLPYLQDSIHDYPHDYLFWQRGISKAVRNNSWKLVINEKSNERLLYNLNNDKYENPEVSAQNPEMVQMLEKKLLKWEKLHAEPLWPPVVFFYANKGGKEYGFEQ